MQTCDTAVGIVQTCGASPQATADPVRLSSANPELGADPVPCSNVLPPLTPVSSAEETMGSAVPAIPQRLEAETIGTPSLTDAAKFHYRGDKTRRRRKGLIALVITLVILAITGASGMLLLHITPPQTHSYPGYLPGSGTLSFFDPLSQEAESRWSSHSTDGVGISCQFTGGTYHVSQQPSIGFGWCAAVGIFSNFAFEMQLTIMQGDCGGMTFRDGDTKGYYYFQICQDSTYAVLKYSSYSSSDAQVLQWDHSSAIHAGLDQQNKIAVVALGSTMSFYVNERQIDQEQDSSYTWGHIALIATSPYQSHTTDVAYSNAGLWTL